MNSQNTVRLNLGSGSLGLKGWVNIDRSYPPDLCNEETGCVNADVYPLPYPDASVDEVRASHVLEHFSHRETMSVLSDWVRVLKPGGVLRVAVPDFDKAIQAYHDGDPLAEGYIMGGHVDENDHHGALFNEEQLSAAFEDLELVDVTKWESEIPDCASLPVSLNVMGTKPGGEPAIDEPIAAERPEPARGAEPEPEPFGWLKDKGWNRYSQAGEDGLLQAIFEAIGATNRIVVECGAGDPVMFSNSRKLIEEGWSAVLIEADEEKAQKLFASYLPATAGVVVENVKAEPQGLHTLDAILREKQVPQTPDLLVIDVDGQDYHLWNSLIYHRPRVVMIEIAAGIDKPEAERRFIPEIGGPGQAGRDAIVNLAWGKGYDPVALTGCNLICVDRTLSHLLAKDEDGNLLPPPKPPDQSSQIHIDPKTIAAVMPMPRIAFTDQLFCAIHVLSPLGIGMERITGIFWGQRLTELMEKHLDDGTKYLLTLDYDTPFERADFLELLRIMETRPDIDALAPVQIGRERHSPLFRPLKQYEREDGVKDGIRVPVEDLMQETMPVLHAHFGLTLIRVDALKRAKKPWFLHHPDANGGWGDGRVDEDIHFWLNWNASGNTVHVANRVSVGHIELVVSWPDRQMRSRPQFVNDFNTNGKPAWAWR